MDSIRNRVLVALIMAGIVPLLVVFVATERITSKAIRDSEEEKLNAVTREIARQVGTTMRAAASDLQWLRLNPRLTKPEMSIEDRLEEMQRLVNAYEKFTDITIYDHRGTMVRSTTKENHPEPWDKSIWLERARDGGGVHISHPHRVRGESGLHLKLYIPVTAETARHPIILIARMRFDPVWDLLDGVRVGDAGRIVLLDSSGKLLATRDRKNILEWFDSNEAQPPRAGIGEYTDRRGVEYVYSAHTLSDKVTRVDDSWTVLGMVPDSEIMEAIRHSEFYLYVVAVGTLIGAVGLGVWLARRMAGPVEQAAEVAQQVAGGDLNAEVPVLGSLETRRLAESFNLMIGEVREHRSQLELLVDSRTRRLRKSQQDLENLSAQLQAAYESTQEAVLVVKSGGAILTSNRRMSEFFDLPEDVRDLAVPQFESRLSRCFAKHRKFSARWRFLAEHPESEADEEWELVRPAKRTLAVYSAPVRNAHGVIFARLWMFRDITEQKQLQEGLQQAQKMEAIGRLAGGVAHDFNNLLTGIIGNLQLAEMGQDDRPPENGSHFITSARNAGQRAAELVRQLLGFSRRTHLDLRFADANSVIGDVRDLLQAGIDPTIAIHTDLSNDLWCVKIDPTQMEQVVMNMCVNAKDAMASGGVIALRTRNRKISSDEAASGDMRVGEFVVISVTDNGEGMSEEVIEKIFEPFFTTKEQGKGTGLGLATSYGIVQQHGGWISCESTVGEGTTFEIFLPRQEPPAQKEAKAPSEITVRGGSETLLLVDDEEIVRSVAEGVLQHHGYEIITAGDGLEALEEFKERAADIDLVLLDLTMPNLTGAETFKVIRDKYGEVPVLVCSGYLVDLDDFANEAGGHRPDGFVQKPYNVRELALKVREILDNQPAAAAATS